MDRTTALGYGTDASGRRCFLNQDLAAGVDGTDADAVFFNTFVEEFISGLIEYAGLAPNAADSAQVRQAILRMIALEVAGYLPLAGGTVTGAVTIDDAVVAGANLTVDGTLGVQGQGTFVGSVSVGGILSVGNQIVATSNITGGGFLSGGNYYTSNYHLSGPTNGNLTPCQSAATGTSMSSGQLNAYNQSGSAGQFGTAAAGDLVDFWVGNVGTIGIQGKITTTGTGVVYGTTSDYRLKQDVVPLRGALDRVAQLTAKQFAFTSAPSVTVDGFLAHEASEVVPHAIAGEKDAVDQNGHVLPQTMDATALVPVLWAAVGELKALIDQQAAQIATLLASGKAA